VFPLEFGVAIGAAATLALIAVCASVGSRRERPSDATRPRLIFWQRFLGVLSIAVAFWFAWGFYGVGGVVAFWRERGLQSNEFGLLGQAGDLFGGINALFAAAAFAGVAVAAFYQHETWKLQAELNKLAQEQHARQGFEPLFFELLQRVPTIEPLRPGPLHQGQEWVSDFVPLEEFADRFRNWLVTSKLYVDSVMEGKGKPLPEAAILSLYLSVYHENQAMLGKHYRALYHVFKLIWDSGLDAKSQVRYANIVRSTLSSDELLVLALNGLTKYGRNFRTLIEQYGLLKHVFVSENHVTPDELIVNSFYAASARLSYRGRSAHWAKHSEERVELDARLRHLEL